MRHWILPLSGILLALPVQSFAGCLSCDDIVHLGLPEQACFRTLFEQEGLPSQDGAPHRYDLSRCLESRASLERGGLVTMPDLTGAIAAASGIRHEKRVYVLDYPYASCLVTIITGMRGRAGTVDLTRLCP